MDKTYVRSINITILGKVWDAYMCNRYSIDEFAKLLGISGSTIDKIKAADAYAGKKWDYSSVAERIGIDKKIFSGEHLIKIDGDCMKYFKEHYEEILDEAKVSAEKRKQLSRDYVIDEYKLWKYILDGNYGIGGNVSGKNNKDFHTLLMRDIAKQVKEENFNDIQLYKFLTFLKKNYNR